MSRNTHDRRRDHFDTDDDSNIVLVSTIGAYPAGTDLQTLFAALYALGIFGGVYEQATDPGAVGFGAWWVDTSSGPPYALSVRDSTDTSWLPIAGGGGGMSDANNNHGTASAVTPAATADIVSFTAGTTKLMGFMVDGDDADMAVCWIEVNGTELPGMRAHMNVAKHAERILPNPEAYDDPGHTVTLRVKNLSGQSGNFVGVILGV